MKEHSQQCDFSQHCFNMMTSSVGKCAAMDTQSIILSLYFCRVLFHSTGFVAQKWKYIARDDHLEIRKIPLTMSWLKKKKVMCWVFKCSSTQVFVMLSATNSRGSVWATHVSMSCILHTFASTCLLSTFRKEKRKNVYSSSWALWTPLWAYIYKQRDNTSQGCINKFSNVHVQANLPVESLQEKT